MTLRRRSPPRRHKASFRNGFLLLVLGLLPLVLAAPAAATSQLPSIRMAFPRSDTPMLTERQAVTRFLGAEKVADWLDRYPDDRSTDASFDRPSGRWKVHVWSGEAGEIATGEVDDASGLVVEAWTGPQVAWKMARGGHGAFGGKVLDSVPVWFGLCAVFVIGLADLRRPLSLRNLDLLVVVSFSASLWFFNRGEIFTSVPLVYPPLVYLLARTAWIGFRRRALPEWRPLWPVWVLAAATVFLAGFRVGLNVGEVLRQATGSGVFGTPVIVASRLCDRAGAGEILASSVVAGLLAGRRAFRFRELGPVGLSGVEVPVSACAVEYEAGHVPGAVSLPLAGIERSLPKVKLDRQKPTAVVCAGGYRSSIACHWFERLGFANVVNVTGGTNAWVKAGLAVEAGA